MSLFQYMDYKKWVTDYVEALPHRGRGQYRKMAAHLNTSSAIMTQVFKGERDLTAEQAVLLSEYLGLSKIERQFFILLVNYSRATSFRYKEILKSEIEEVKVRAQELKYRVQQSTELTPEAKAILYSNWYYLAIWSLTAIPEFDNLESIADRLDLSRIKTKEALEFLVKYSLVIEENGKFKIGPKLIHLESSSPQIPRHHQNWRLRAFQRYESARPQDLFFTGPITISEKDAAILRERLVTFISDAVLFLKDSPSEKLYSLCLDWFEV
jgi:uncharacterized protein (TIGR02147 family)